MNVDLSPLPGADENRAPDKNRAPDEHRAQDPGFTLFLAPELPHPNAGGRNYLIRRLRVPSAWLANTALRLLLLLRLNRTQARLLANDYTADALVGLITEDRIERYDRALLLAVETLDFAPLHRFADTLEEKSHTLTANGASFTHRGLSLSKIHEIRWIWPVAYNCAFSRLCLTEISQHSATQFKALGWSGKLPAAVLAADRAGLSVDIVTQRLAGASARLQYRAQSRFLHRVVPHYLNKTSKQRRALATRSDDRKRMLVIGNFDRTIERLERLMPALASAGFDLHVTALPRVERVANLRELGVECSLVSDWIEPGEANALQRKTASAARKWWREVEAARADFNQESYGVRVYDNAREILKAHVLNGAGAAALAAEVSTRVMDAYAPDIVLNFEDWDFNRAASLLARQRGIPTLAYYCLSAPGHAGMVRRTQEWMAVAGENLRSAFAFQYDPDHIRVVGDPLVTAQELRCINVAELRQKLGLKIDARYIVLMSSYPTAGIALEDIEQIFRRTFHAATALGVEVVVKAHPAQPIDEVRNWMRAWNLGNDAIILRDCSLSELCSAVDVASVPVTSAVHQALLVGTPVVCLQSTRSLEPFESMGFDYLTGKGVVHVAPDIDATSIIRALIFDSDARAEQVRKGFDHAKEHVGPIDGGAPQRFVAFVQYILSHG